jgi:hypothetical protein
MALTALLWGTSYDVGAAAHVMAVWGLGCLILSGLAVWLANGTLRHALHTWEAHLARASARSQSPEDSVCDSCKRPDPYQGFDRLAVAT